MYICMMFCCTAENHMTINYYFLLSTKFFIYSALIVNLCIFLTQELSLYCSQEVRVADVAQGNLASTK